MKSQRQRLPAWFSSTLCCSTLSAQRPQSRPTRNCTKKSIPQKKPFVPNAGSGNRLPESISLVTPALPGLCGKAGT